RCHVGKVVVGHEGDRGISVLEHAVDDDVVLGEEPCKADPAVLGDRVAHPRPGVVGVEVDDPCRVNRCGYGRDGTVGEDVDVMHTQRVERCHRASGGRAKADDHRAQPTPVVPGGPGDLHGVEHRAVAGKLIVLVEHVQVEGTVAMPVVHRLEGDQRELVDDGDLGELRVLHTGGP